MTPDEFASMTRGIIGDGGLDEFLPTACFPERQEVRALAGAPADGDLEKVVLEWAGECAEAGEEYLVAFRASKDQFKVVRRHGELKEEQNYEWV